MEIIDFPTVIYRNWNVMVVYNKILQKKVKTRIIEKVLNIKNKQDIPLPLGDEETCFQVRGNKPRT